ncbi:MAG: hypothetical protein AAEJ04_02190 [Planctomycetota bacterium]
MLAALLLFCLLTPAPLHLQAPDDDVTTWIADLGADDWARREEAARQILEAGPAAVEDLRATLLHPDPEIRARAKELLAILSPPILYLDVVRIGNLPDANQRSIRQEITGTTIRFHHKNLVQTTVASHKEERRIQAEIRGTEPPYSIEILFPGINTASISGPPARGVASGTPWVIFSEERVVMEKAQGEIRTDGELATWVALLSNELDEESSELSPQQRIANAIKEKLPDSDDPALMLLAGIWQQAGEIPETRASSNKRLHDATLIARLCRKDPEAAIQLADLVSLHLDGTDTMSAERIDALIPFLIDANIENSIDLFVQHCGDLSPWSQHLIWKALQDKIEDPQFAQTHGKILIQAILSSEALPVLRWTNSRMASLWTALHQIMPTETWSECLQGGIADALADDIAQSSGRIPLILGTLAYLSNNSVSLPTGWEPSVVELLASQHAEIALGVLTAQDRKVGIDEEIWLQAIEKIGFGLASTDTTVSFRVRSCITRLTNFKFLSETARRALLSMLAIALEKGAPNHRSTADQLLTKNVGGPSPPRPRTKSTDFYVKRSEYWKERLVDLPAEELYPDPPADGTWVQLSMVDLKIDPQGTAIPIRMQRLILKTGQRVIRIGNEGEDESILIENNVNNTYRLSGSILLFENRPVLARLRTKWRRWAHRYNSTRLGPESAEIRSNISYQTLVLLQTLDPETGQKQQGWDPTIDWSDVEKSILEALESADRTSQMAAIDIATTLKLTSALEILIRMWEETPNEAVARGLLALEDDRGIDLLISALNTLETRITRDAQKALEMLILIGNPTAVDQVLTWLELPVPERNRVLENQLPMALRSLETLISKDSHSEAIPRQRLLNALVQRTDTRNLRSYAIPMLRRLTGVDLGWWNTFSITDIQERNAAQEEISGLWKSWWARKTELNENPVKLEPLRDR